MKRILFPLILVFFISSHCFAGIQTRFRNFHYCAKSEYRDNFVEVTIEKMVGKNRDYDYQEILYLDIRILSTRIVNKIRPVVKVQIDHKTPKLLKCEMDEDINGGIRLYINQRDLYEIEKFNENSQVKLFLLYKDKTEEEFILSQEFVQDWVEVRDYIFTEEEMKKFHLIEFPDGSTLHLEY